jgi:hypothetical protein
VGLSGAVASVRLLSPELQDTAFATCMQAAVRQWTFPAQTVEAEPIVFPFEF